VALPKAHENDPPSFHHHPGATLPKLELPGVRMTVIAGDAFGAESPVRVYSRTLYVAIEMDAGASLVIPPNTSSVAFIRSTATWSSMARRCRPSIWWCWYLASP
jgi:redox-sensitive bicupin YhaK (pirin superfamily)